MFLAVLEVTGVNKIIPTIIDMKVGKTATPKITFNVTKIATPMATVKPYPTYIAP
jgi:hypothetical protein